LRLRHSQWFYFRVENMRSDLEYKFSILNFTKPDSQYAVGMRPVLYSQREAETRGVGWTRCGDLIRYYRNQTVDKEQERRHFFVASCKE
jgi:hypothetical protein